MDIQPLPTTPNKTTSADQAVLGQDAEAIEEAFESELLSWLAVRPVEASPTPSLEEVASIEAEALDEPLFTLDGELLGAFGESGRELGKLSVKADGLEEASLLSKAKPSAAAPQLTEEQLNLRKLVDYLNGLTKEGTSKSGSAPPAEPAPVAPDEPEPSAEPAPSPKPEAKAELGADLERAPTLEAEGEAQGPTKTSLSGRFEGGEGQRGFGQHAQALAEAQLAPSQSARESHMSDASRRMMAELRDRLTERTQGRLPLNLVLEEAAVPMRLRFQPGAGGHEVAFVVNTMKARQELRRLMPEIETVLTELPVEVADVRIEIEPRLMRQAQEKRR